MTKLQKIIIFSIIVAIVIGVSATAAILFSQQKTTTEQQNGGAAIPPPSPAEEKADEAEKAALEGNVDEGVATLEKALESTTDTNERYIYYTNIATIQFNADEFEKALTAAKNAYDIKKSADAAAFVGQIAKAKGDRREAIDYYRKAISALDPTDPFSDEDKTHYEEMIAEIERGQ